MLERLEPFVGEWAIEAAFRDAPPPGAAGGVVFEWALGGAFLLQRSEVSHPDAPDGLCVIASDPEGGTYTQHYFDSRGVVRIYAMTFDGRVWTLERTTPDFHAAELCAALRRHLQRRRLHHRRPLGDRPRRPGLGA
jgi:hypothetical protein